MQHRFFALISRMRYIGRWGLMRNTFEENIQEHSHMVAVLAHGLAMIQRDILGEPADPDRCAAAALFHDASEILTGDLPTPSAAKSCWRCCRRSCRRATARCCSNPTPGPRRSSRPPTSSRPTSNASRS